MNNDNQKYTDFDSYWRANRASLMEIYSQLDPWLSLLRISENIWRASHITAIDNPLPSPCQAACGSTPPADLAPTPTITEEEQSYINWLTQRKTGAT